MPFSALGVVTSYGYRVALAIGMAEIASNRAKRTDIRTTVDFIQIIAIILYGTATTEGSC